MIKKALIRFITTSVAVSLMLCTMATVTASKDWPLKVVSLSGKTVTLSHDQLLSMPKTIVNADLFCYGMLLTSENWGGVKLSLLLETSELDLQASSVDFYAQDGYKATVPFCRAIQPDVIVAYDKDGVPLPETLRLVVPGANGAVWIAMITSIELSASTSEIEGQSGAEGMTVLDRLQSSFLAKGQNLPQSKDESTNLANEPANITRVEPETPVVIDKQQSQQKPGETSRVGFSTEIQDGIVLVTIGVVATTTLYLVDRRKKGSNTSLLIVIEAGQSTSR